MINYFHNYTVSELINKIFSEREYLKTLNLIAKNIIFRLNNLDISYFMPNQTK